MIINIGILIKYLSQFNKKLYQNLKNNYKFLLISIQNQCHVINVIKM